ncbi:MAG: Holliday junction branch migration protein RuvA [Bacteroidales bacterium]|nr:Holliday junction branch migration protein RuvA [Bacteroidales bacterium]
MIEYVRGIVDELTPTQAVLEAAGVGYALGITLNTYTALQGKSQARLYVYESIREDAYQLYGFFTRDERAFFQLLIDVQGVGPQTARMVLSAFTPVELKNIVLAEDVRMLKSVKGIGPKAAARIVMDLKDKVVALAGNESGGGGKDEAVATAPAVVEEAVQALAVLGFSPAPTHKVVMQIVKDEPALQVEQIIKKALKML